MLAELSGAKFVSQAVLKRALATAGGPRPLFGADAVVIVREQDQKHQLPPLLQHCLCMTVWEASPQSDCQ